MTTAANASPMRIVIVTWTSALGSTGSMVLFPPFKLPVRAGCLRLRPLFCFLPISRHDVDFHAIMRKRAELASLNLVKVKRRASVMPWSACEALPVVFIAIWDADHAAFLSACSFMSS